MVKWEYQIYESVSLSSSLFNGLWIERLGAGVRDAEGGWRRIVVRDGVQARDCIDQYRHDRLHVGDADPTALAGLRVRAGHSF